MPTIPSRETTLRPPTPEEIEEFIPLHTEKQALDARVRNLTAEGSRYHQLRAIINAWTDSRPATMPLVLQGVTRDLGATARRMEASPNWKTPKVGTGRGLIKDFGIQLVLKFCSITQEAVKRILIEKKRPESEYEAYFTKERNGYRTLSVVAKTGPTPAASYEDAA